MKFLRLVAVLVAVTLLIGVLPLVSASTSGIGTPTMRARATANPNQVQIISDGITDGGIPGNGAAAFTVWFTLPSNVVIGDVSVVPGPAFVAQNCNFTTFMSVQPPIGGRNTIQLDGFCTTTYLGPHVTGSNVLVATLTFSANACSANPGGFLVDITAEGDNTSLFEPDGTPYIFPASALTDGGACGNPTAVQLANITAGPVAPMSNALYPALAGAAALLAAAGVAFKGMRKH